MKDVMRKLQRDYKKDHWEETGDFTSLKVNELYISEFEETIRKILGKAAKERKINVYQSAEIVEILGISPHTVSSHHKNIFRKTNASSVLQLVKPVLEKGMDLICSPSPHNFPAPIRQ